jgi:hypothetical protein
LALLPLTAALIAGAASPAHASSEQPRTVTRVLFVQGPQHFARHGRLTIDLQDEATVDQLAAKAALRGGSAGGVEPMAEAAAERLARVNDAEYGTPSAAVAQYDDITVEECRERVELSGRRQGWIKNHYSYCQMGAMAAVQQRCTWIFCRTIGAFSARVTLLGHAYNGLRNVDWTVTLDQIAAFGSANGGRLTFEIECAGWLTRTRACPAPTKSRAPCRAGASMARRTCCSSRRPSRRRPARASRSTPACSRREASSASPTA